MEEGFALMMKGEIKKIEESVKYKIKVREWNERWFGQLSLIRTYEKNCLRVRAIPKNVERTLKKRLLIPYLDSGLETRIHWYRIW